MLVALAEQGRPVTLHVGTGRRHRGLIVRSGATWSSSGPVGRQVIVALAALESVRPQADVGAVSAGAVATGATLAEVIGRLAEQRERVLVVARSGEATTGELTAVGRDVLTLRLDAGGVAYLSLAALAEVSGARVGVEVLERAGLDAAGVDEGVDVGGLQPDDPPEAVGRDLALVDEPVERAGRDAEPVGRFAGAEPADLIVGRCRG